MTLGPQAPASDPNDILDPHVSSPRMATFLTAARQDRRLARTLYVWNRDLSTAFLADIAILEVALRNAMHRAASNVWSERWYENVQLDSRSDGQLRTAWNYLPRQAQNNPQDARVPGRLVAQCMFGFWTNLLDAGGFVGKPPRQKEVKYDNLWENAFKGAFPGGRLEAKRERREKIQENSQKANPLSGSALDSWLEPYSYTRVWVHGVCKDVNSLRNRVAHHEPLIVDFPLSGQRRRMTATEGHKRCLMLARMLDAKLASWIVINSKVPGLLSSRPQ